MNIGLLWFDDSGKDIAEKVTAAARAHRRKYGTEPDTCYCHPEMLTDGKPVEVGGVRVEPLATVLRHHYWIGVEDA